MREVRLFGTGPVTVDRQTLCDIEVVLRYVARGRGNLDVNYAYPDALARKALDALIASGAFK